MIVDEGEYLAHYGVLRRSGRYPWGSGGNDSYIRSNKEFLDYVHEMRQKGLSEKTIAQGVGISQSELRKLNTIAKAEKRQADITQVQRLTEKGMGSTAISQRTGLPESTVRLYQKPGQEEKAKVLDATTLMLKQQVAEKGYLDVGSGTEQHIGVSETKFRAAIASLKQEGYEVHYPKVQQVGTGKETTLKVLCPPGTTQKDAFLNRYNVKTISNFSDDGGRTYFGIVPPMSIHPDRVEVRYKEQGGAEADGVIFVRPGVKDVELGGSTYAQVRIKVGDGHYLKGMAMYKNDLPPGKDLLFNTNKSDTGNKLDAMKPVTDNPENPFGSMISRQITVKDHRGKDQVTSVMNLVNEEGSWGEWSKSLSSQVLSKQSPTLIKSQLSLVQEQRKKEFDNINSLTNPVVKRKLLLDYADSTEAASIHLKAAALPRQASHVILPISSMPPNQIYAPNYRDGERVVLIRHPHGGKFEIPELVVNNKHPEAKALLGNAKDAVGIHHSVAERLSGADFDGDTVLVIPNNHGKISHSPALEGLKNFDPKVQYKGYEGMPKLSPKRMQREMGDVSNLITDMTIKGAHDDEIARAVRHSMVVIDAPKHGLNYKQSAIDNGIAQLKAKYQGGPRAGSSTLISKARSQARVPQRIERPMSKGGPIDTQGSKVYLTTGKTYTNKQGKVVVNTSRSTKLAEAKSAHELSSGTPVERIYADHSDSLRAMAHDARAKALLLPGMTYSPSAKQTYHHEVTQLDSALALAKRNRPLERQAQIIANTVIRARRRANPDMDQAELKKVKSQALDAARARVGAKKTSIVITPKQWEAIQAGAVSTSKLNDILSNADMDVVKQLASPKETKLMTATKTSRAKTMLGSGYTRAEVADALGVSLTTLDLATA